MCSITLYHEDGHSRSLQNLASTYQNTLCHIPEDYSEALITVFVRSPEKEQWIQENDKCTTTVVETDVISDHRNWTSDPGKWYIW
jgi:hypothetical protein